MVDTPPATRFNIRIDWWCQPFLLFIGVSPGNAYVDLTADELRIKFGPAFDRIVERSSITHVAPMSWSFIDGVGIRAGGQVFGVIGAPAGVIELTLSRPADLRFAGWPWTSSRIAISIEDPDAFVAAVSPRK